MYNKPASDKYRATHPERVSATNALYRAKKALMENTDLNAVDQLVVNYNLARQQYRMVYNK
mgnify:CR=1 FL=1